MQISKLLIVVVMLAAALALAPVANAQSSPTVSVTAGGAIIEGETATFTVELSEPAVEDVEVGFVLEEIERVGSWVNSDLVPDAAEGAASVTIRAGQSSAVVSVATHADGVHEDSSRQVWAHEPADPVDSTRFGLRRREPVGGDRGGGRR